jgi:predicted nucleic acid-binding protein
MIVDSNIIIDLLSPDRPDAQASIDAYAEAVSATQCLIDHVIFAEVASRFRTAGQVASDLAKLGLVIEPLDDMIAFRAGLAFREYRRRGGPRGTILPDFLIGAHAEIRGVPILTRDTQRFASYFPNLELVSPTSAINS